MPVTGVSGLPALNVSTVGVVQGLPVCAFTCSITWRAVIVSAANIFAPSNPPPSNAQMSAFFMEVSTSRRALFDIGRRSLRMRLCAAFGEPQHPLDGLEIHFLDVGVVPRFVCVAECGVENAA